MTKIKVHLNKTLATAGVFLVMSTLYLPIVVIVTSAWLIAMLCDALIGLLDMILWLSSHPKTRWYFDPGWWLGERSYFG